MDEDSEYILAHSYFFTQFKSQEFLSDISTDNNVSASFKHNIESVISILNIPIILSTTRTKMNIFQKHLLYDVVLNAKMEDGDKSKEEYEKERKASSIKSNLKAKEKFFEEIKSKEGMENYWNTTFQFLEDCIRSNQELKDASKELIKQSTILLWSSFEVLVRDLAIDVINRNPDVVKEFNVKSVPMKTLEQYDYNIKNHLGDIYSDHHDWSSLKTIKETIKLIYPVNNELHALLKSDDLYKLNSRRHLLVHRRGIVDYKYNETTSDDFTIGDEIPITPDDVRNDLYTIKEIGISILDAYAE